MIQPAFRPATPDDAGTLAELVQFASEGLALYLWTQIAGAGHDPWNIGRERVRSEAYDELPAVLIPLHELMNHAPDTWYVHALAAYPSYRGKGQGSALLAVADNLAAAAGITGLSLIVSDTNVSARKLYERCGYREAAHCEMVKEHWLHPGTNWVLMK